MVRYEVLRERSAKKQDSKGACERKKQHERTRTSQDVTLEIAFIKDPRKNATSKWSDQQRHTVTTTLEMRRHSNIPENGGGLDINIRAVDVIQQQTP